MAYDHLWTPPDPKMAYKKQNTTEKSQTKNLQVFWPLLRSARCGGIGILILRAWILMCYKCLVPFVDMSSTTKAHFDETLSGEVGRVYFDMA